MTTEIQWSELQRDPKEVARLAEKGVVRVRRRDGAPLLLVREDTVEDDVDGSIAAARALRNIVVHMPRDAAYRALAEEFPWLDYLPEEDRSEFVADFVRAFHASAELGQWSVLAQVMREWRTTASIHADPILARQLAAEVSADHGPVTAPLLD